MKLIDSIFMFSLFLVLFSCTRIVPNIPHSAVEIKKIKDGFIMPDLEGRKLSEVQDCLSQIVIEFACDVHLKSGYGETKFSGGTIMKQTPSKGKPVKYHDTIEIEVANTIECAG